MCRARVRGRGARPAAAAARPRQPWRTGHPAGAATAGWDRVRLAADGPGAEITRLRDAGLAFRSGLVASPGGRQILLAGVVALSMLLLLLAFRSIAIPVTAAVMNLLSVGAAYGVVVLVLQGGWAGQLAGIDTQAPMPPFIPVLIFAVLFGLSMDYEVFLVSRMRESWLRTNGHAARAVVDGLAGTGRVITAAAAIMIAVFAAFVPSPEVTLKVIGVGMAAAIAIDATVVRMLLVPAIMHLLGRANWWLPRSADRRLPQLRVKGRPDAFVPSPRSAAHDAGSRELDPADAAG